MGMVALIFIIAGVVAGGIAFIQGKSGQTKGAGAAGALLAAGGYLIPANVAMSQGVAIGVQLGLAIVGFGIAMWAFNTSKVDAMNAAIGED